MSSPTPSMAPVVESTDSNMSRGSHSSPDLLLGTLPNKQPTTRSTHTLDIRHTAGTNTLSTLPPAVFTHSTSSTSSSSSTPLEAAAARAAGTAKLASASTPDLFTACSSPTNTSSLLFPKILPSSSSSTADYSTKSLPSLPAFDVPSFDFDTDLDNELEFSMFQKHQKKSNPTSEPPRRLWEQFIKADGDSQYSNNSKLSPLTSDFGIDIEARFGAPSTDTSNYIRPTRSLLDLTAANDSHFVSRETCLQQRPSTAVSPSTKQEAFDKKTDLTETEGLPRRRSFVERPLSWISSSRSAPDFHELLVKEREKEARKSRLAADEAASRPATSRATFSRKAKDERLANTTGTATANLTAAPALQADGNRMVERQKTVSASFVDFAKRSWISRSSSPSPPPSRKSPAKKDSNGEESSRSGGGGGRFSRKRPVSTTFFNSNSAGNDNVNPAEIGQSQQLPASDKHDDQNDNQESRLDVRDSTAMANDDGDKGLIGPWAKAQSANGGAAAPPAQTMASSPSTSKTFSRASEYLSRMKQRPQSMFVKAVANSTSTKLSGFNDELSRESASAGFDDDGSGKNPSTVSSSSLFLSLELLANKGAKNFDTAGRKQSENSSSSSSANSDDGSSDGSATGSTMLPASEAESLTTADTSNHNSPMSQPNSRDPLWVAFKDLETNFFKFLSKTTTAQRMIIVRATLVPFLRRYAFDRSNKDTSLLSPEDIERRASILNRWWTGLLEMLDTPSQWQGSSSMGQTGGLFGGGAFFGTSTTLNGNFTPVSGIDRPVVLESVSMIMSRPEWRLLTAVFRPLSDRPMDVRVSSQTTTGDSQPLDESAIFVEESAEHNVRTMFVNNLLAQLILVVDKMGIRHAPLSIVNFSGKACAYAFFFVPGVADILVRLWGLDKNIELVRRVTSAYGLPRRRRGESDDLAALFPPCIAPLCWSSVNDVQAKLRRPPKMSLLPPAYVSACSRLSWFAPCWLARWRGADTDLLFIFCKYYHVLADEFMPANLQLPLAEKARAPGFVLLHAQLLQIFDNTIHRQAAVEAAMLMAGAPVGDSSPSLWIQQQMQQQQSLLLTPSDDSSGGFDLAMRPSHNLFRDMEENRIVALLRDLLNSDESLSGVRATFSESTMVLLKAATLRTSQYDHNACYILCDFLHEILQTFNSYYGYCNENDINEDNTSTISPEPVDYIDWTFWLDICKMMLDSNNTMSEIRVLSFVFTTWDLVTAEPNRKEELCVRWLLTEEVFDKFFNNWCPMVRAYYMRLLCWRMCRDSGSANELDAKIFLLVSQRLNTVWSHYLWLKQKADNEGTLQPTTAPSLPQPGKRFMIVRTEVSMPQLGLLANSNNNGGNGSFGTGMNSRPPTTFDALASTVDGINTGSNANLYGNDSAVASNAPPVADERKLEAGSAKKKWSLLGKVLNLTTKPPSDDEFDQMRKDTAASRSANKAGGPSLPSKPVRLGSSSSDSISSTGSTPIFDAPQSVFKFMLNSIPWQGFEGGQEEIVLPPAYRERVLTRPRLPAPAQSRVSARVSASGNRSGSPPPPAAGLPPVTRRVSGLPSGGLISEARNANLVESESIPSDDASSGRSYSESITSRPSTAYQRDNSPFANGGDWVQDRTSSPVPRNGSPNSSDFARERERIVVQPVEPQGSDCKLRTKYAGRALAEWSLVVNECNSFVDRRRDEGVYGLKDVEVPTLSVEGMRRLA